MPAKCNKVKNPCKICLETVSNKNGLQCQGACRKWVHYSCLNYTPGKIKDIKQGIIRVTCPCPDCKTTAPKEFRTDEPFSCTNIQCPSNMPRSCISNSCPSNQDSNGNCGPKPLLHCEKETCKHNKVPFGTTVQLIPPASPPCAPPPCAPPPCAAAVSCPASSSGSSLSPRGDMGSRNQAMSVVEQICTTVGQLSNQIHCLMNEMKTMLGPSSMGPGCTKTQDVCDQPGPIAKPCNCPGNPRH